jgi:hypothetical protein
MRGFDLVREIHSIFPHLEYLTGISELAVYESI